MKRTVWSMLQFLSLYVFVIYVLCPISGPGAVFASEDETGSQVQEVPSQEKKLLEEAPKVISLSLAQVVELALENNLDISIERYNPHIGEMDIVRAQAEFDPEFSFDIEGGQSATPGFSSLEGEMAWATRRDENFLFDVGFSKKYLTGATGSVFFSNRRYQTNRSGLFLNPSWSSDLTFSLTQPLLRGLGRAVNESDIIIARNNKAVSLYEFKGKVIDVLQAVQEAYWSLIYAYEDLKVKEDSLKLAQELLDKNRKRVAVGILPPIEVKRAEAEVAKREEGILVAENRIRDLSDQLRKLINLPESPLVEDVLIRPGDEAEYKKEEVDATSTLREALLNRPDYLEAKKDLENRDVTLVVTKNALLPQLDLTATYNINGLGGNYGNDIDVMTSTDYFDWEVGLSFSISLGNRKAKSEYIQAKWEKEKAILDLRNLEHGIIVEVKSAVREVETDFKRIKTNRTARILAEERLRAEEKRFEIGLSDSLDVLTAQEALAIAESREKRAIIDYNLSLVRLEEAKGTLISESSVVFNEQTARGHSVSYIQ